jgi:hypothetical protein
MISEPHVSTASLRFTRPTNIPLWPVVRAPSSPNRRIILSVLISTYHVENSHYFVQCTITNDIIISFGKESLFIIPDMTDVIWPSIISHHTNKVLCQQSIQSLCSREGSTDMGILFLSPCHHIHVMPSTECAVGCRYLQRQPCKL